MLLFSGLTTTKKYHFALFWNLMCHFSKMSTKILKYAHLLNF